MTFYSATLLPSYPPYATMEVMISALCSRCITEQESDSLPEHVKQQFFDYTLSLIEFWYEEFDSSRPPE